jgi:hypothetical protein
VATLKPFVVRPLAKKPNGLNSFETFWLARFFLKRGGMADTLIVRVMYEAALTTIGGLDVSPRVFCPARKVLI